MASNTPIIVKNNISEKSNMKIPHEKLPSATSIASKLPLSASTVSPHRKQELLVEARRARVEWVDSSSNPFLENVSFGANMQAINLPSILRLDSEPNDMISQALDQKNVIRRTYAGKSIPSALEVVKLLYGAGEEEGGGLNYQRINERILKQLSSQVSSEDINKVISNHQNDEKKSSLLSITNMPNRFKENEIIAKNEEIWQAMQNYTIFIQKLRSPESADIVQSTKHFIDSIPDIVAKHTVYKSKQSGEHVNYVTKDQKKKSENSDVMATAKHVAQSIHSYLDTRFESIQKIHTPSKISKKSESTSDEMKSSDFDTYKNESINEVHYALQKLAKSIQTYLNSTCDAIKKSHSMSPAPLSSIWLSKRDEEDENNERKKSEKEEPWEAMQLAFESFVYSKCHETIWSILNPHVLSSFIEKNTSLVKLQEEEEEEPNRRILETMKKLGFVNAEHLEIQCILKCDAYRMGVKKDKIELEDDTDYKNDTSDQIVFDLREIFMTPIQLLQSLSIWYSPADKLRCIHETYKEIVIILSNISNLSKSSSNENQPSADDILPAFIYVLIQAQPFPVVSNLIFIETMAREEQLRGEAGYAFTNLYGAVQFLLDLNLNVDDYEEKASHEKVDCIDTKKKSLPFAIEAGEWKAHLKKYQEKKMTVMMKSVERSSSLQEDDSIDVEEHETKDTKINCEDKSFPSIFEVRTARLKGEKVDMEWIEKWQTKQHDIVLETPKSSEGKEEASPPNMKEMSKQKNVNNMYHPTFPAGFTRSYTFLGKKPQDIRMGDIAQLLAEYHQLVNVCETMVSERNAIQKEAQKLRIQRQRTKLQNIAVAADASTSNDKGEVVDLI